MRYFFDVSDAGETTFDTEGLELGTREDAALEAAKILSEIAFHQIATSRTPYLVLTVQVREGSRPLLTRRLTIENVPPTPQGERELTERSKADLGGKAAARPA
jgi:hypothetical protein